MKEAIYIITGFVGLLIALGLVRGLWSTYPQTVTIWDYQVGLHYRHRKFIGELKAGKHRLWGAGHEVVLCDSRITELVVQGQEFITSDCASVKVTAVAQWKIVDAATFHTAVNDSRQALYTIIQLALRELFGKLTLDELVRKKNTRGHGLLELIKNGTAELGIQIANADLRDVMLSGELKNAYTAVITSKQESLTKLENARGEAAALRTLANAARLFEKNPDLFRLQYLDTLKQAATSGNGNTLIIGVPEELAGLAKTS